MLVRAVLMSLLVMAGSPGSARAQEIAGSAYVMSQSPAGVCPATVSIEGTIRSNMAGQIRYQWVRSDGTESPEETAFLNEPGSVSVMHHWRLAPTAGRFAGWVKMRLSFENVSAESEPVSVTVQCAAPAPPPEPRLSASATVSPASHAGTCPTRLTFDGQIRSDQPGNVRYVWVRSDGVISPEATVTFAGPGVQPVRTTWELGTPGFSGQVSMVLRVLTRGRAISSTPAAAVLRCAAPPPVALPPKVSPEVRVALFVSPVRHKGPCPVTIKFEAVIKSNVAGPVRYVWERSDGARSPERTVTFAAPGEQVVAEKWSLGAANVKTKAGQVLRILSPVANVSATFAAIVECDGPAVTPPPVTPPRVTPPPVTPPPVLPKAAVTVSASVEPARHDGACPVTVRFTGVIGSNRAGPVRYRWISGGFRDNRTETGPDQTITFDAPGSRTVTDTWAHERRFKGWRKLELLAPATATSAEAAFEVICSGDDAKKKRKPKE